MKIHDLIRYMLGIILIILMWCGNDFVLKFIITLIAISQEVQDSVIKQIIKIVKGY